MDYQPTFQEFREEWLADIREGNPSTTELGHRFARKILTQWRDVDESSDDLVYCDGAGDGGIDIAYLDRGEEVGDDEDSPADGHTWYLVQSKYGSAFRGTGTLLEESQKVIDTLDGQRHRLSSLAEALLGRLNTFRRQASERDRIVLVFATEVPLDEDQLRVLGGVRAIVRDRLGPIFDVEAVSIENIYLRTLEDTAASAMARLKIPLKGKVVSSGEDLLVGAVSLTDLYEFLKTYRAQTQDLDQLYEKNVRRFLGNRGKVNRAMQKTLRDEPSQFGLYNNGITIVVRDFEREDGQVALSEPYVVNGCQTTRTIWEVLHQQFEAGGTGTDQQTETWREQVGQGVVVAKIVKVGASGEALLLKITRFTNSQNAVREKDFLALTKDFRAWAGQMADRYNVYLEIQRGGWDSRRALQRQNPTITPQFHEAANAFDLIKVYGAGWLGEAGTAFGKNAPFLPDGKIFKMIMNNEIDDEPFGVDDLYAAYRLQKAADKYHFGRRAPQVSRRQTRFLFYMVVMELLRDVIVRADMTPTPSPKDFTRAFMTLIEPGNEVELDALLDTAIEVIDEYLTQGTDDAVFDEPAFNNTFNNDLNAFLKWDRLGKSEDDTPRLRSLIGGYRKTLGWSAAGQASRRELITAAITSGFGFAPSPRTDCL